MTNALIRKLENFALLTAPEKQAITKAISVVRKLDAHDDLIRQGEPTGVAHLMLEGFGCRYRSLSDGRRQIVGFFLPGDFCDPRIFILDRMDHSIATIASSTVAVLSKEAVAVLAQYSPALARSLWWSTLVDEAIAREWVVNLGQRSAFERMAHLFCEVFHRPRAAGMSHGQSCGFPLTQIELGESLGLSTVHVNRTLQDLRQAGLITLKNAVLTIPNLPALEKTALFDGNYLHLGHEGYPLDSRPGLSG